MAITIKDLPQSDELDRKAMSSIAGGARAGVRPIDLNQYLRSARIVDYPPGFGRDQAAQANAKRNGP